MAHSKNRPYGVSVQLPENDPFNMPHLLGEDWEGTRWYATIKERDEAMASIINQPRYYRKGDKPSILVTAIERANANP